MTIHTTYTNARTELTKLLDEVSYNQETFIINRRGQRRCGSHLLRSPQNATRLLKALNRALSDTESAMNLEDLKDEVGIEGE